MSEHERVEDHPFDPSRHLTKVGSADYLEVKWRLVWLRDLHPDAELETDLHSNDGSFAIFRAKITIPGGGSATGWGSEGMDDFRDYLEKAETKAIGRACAALGFGTQFCPDFDFGAAQGRVVDSPIDFASTRGRRLDDRTPSQNPSRGSSGGDDAITPRQVKYVYVIARELGMSEDDVHEEVKRTYGKEHVSELNKRDGSAFIDRLQGRSGSVDLSS